MVLTIITQFLLICGGITVFMIGMKTMGSNLEKAAGASMRSMLAKVSNNRFAGVGIGAAVTAIINSSAATTVMIVGFVNVGLMTLTQAGAIIMGANIGTTISAQIMSLQSIKINMAAVFSVVAVAGLIVGMVGKSGKAKQIGNILLGVGFIFIGLQFMSDAVKVLTADAEVSPLLNKLFQSIKNPFLLFIIGIILTALLQSSAAITGILIALAGTGLITIEQAVFITMGSNIGTCATSLIASLGTNTNAKRAAVIHLLFNVLGCIVFFTLTMALRTYVIKAIVTVSGGSVERQIANFHTTFNLCTTLLLLPFLKPLVRLAEIIVPERKRESKEGDFRYLDDRILQTPAIAVAQLRKEIVIMMDMAMLNFRRAMKMIGEGDLTEREESAATELRLNQYNTELMAYCVRVSSCELSAHDEFVIGSYYHVISDCERIGDYSKHIVEYAVEIDGDSNAFTPAAMEEIRELYQMVEELYAMARKTFDERDITMFEQINELKVELARKKNAACEEHIERLNRGECTPARGAIFLQLLANMERVGGHIKNISNSVMKSSTRYQKLLKTQATQTELSDTVANAK